MSLSQVPEKPLGLYDPSFDKDACGVGFVAELSGEYNRKTVSFWFFLMITKIESFSVLSYLAIDSNFCYMVSSYC